MARTVTRFLTYAWVEYGNPLDGQAFTDGLFNMGWKNAVHGFPLETDAFGARHIDAVHPLLPIRWRGSSMLILPNERLDLHDLKKVNPFIKDPIFESFRNTNGDDAFDQEIQKQNAFIGDWVFSPGIRRVSSTESRLTKGSDITGFVDMVAISGHGAGGLIYGGGRKCPLSQAATGVPDPPSGRLKYIVIAACTQLRHEMLGYWLPVMRRSRPINGFLGYRDVYPGNEVGKAVFQRFMDNLRANGRKNSILKAWRDAHAGRQKKIWAALMFTSSAKKDNMNTWLDLEIEAPDPTSEIRWFHEDNFVSDPRKEGFPGGEPAIEEEATIVANFFNGDVRIDRSNNSAIDRGLFAGQPGALVIERSDHAFARNSVDIVFYYYRPDHDPGMNLDKLLDFGKADANGLLHTDDGDLLPLKDVNQVPAADGTPQGRPRGTPGITDAIRFTFTKPGLFQTRIPFVVRPESIKAFAPDGDSFGYFTVKVPQTGVDATGAFAFPPFEFWLLRDGAWLRASKP
jgi:hypothetical protein